MTPDEIDKWKPEQIGEVFRLCNARQTACTAASDELKSPGLFSSWGGISAEAANKAAHRKRTDIDSHGNEVAQVGAAASKAQTEVEAVKKNLQAARELCAREMLRLDNSTGRVSLWPIEDGTANVDRQNDVRIAQSEVDKVMTDADRADYDLSLAIQAATGLIAPYTAGVGASAPESADHLPGQPVVAPGQPAIGPRYPTGATRVLPIRVPKGWSDPTKSGGLAKKYAVPVTIDPTSRGATGSFSDNLLPTNPLTGGGVGVPAGKGESLDVGIAQQKQIRVVGAQPANVHSVEINGESFLAIDYEYKYEVDDLKIANVDEIKLPDSGPDWQPATKDQVLELAKRGVPLPDPGRY